HQGAQRAARPGPDRRPRPPDLGARRRGPGSPAPLLISGSGWAPGVDFRQVCLTIEERLVVAETGTMRVKSGLAEMLKGGVIMDVTDAAQARIAEDAGACAVMALERVPADIRKDGGVARMADPGRIREIQEA